MRCELVATERREFERTLRHIDIDDVVRDNTSPEIHGLLAHEFHEFRTTDPVLSMRSHVPAFGVLNRRVEVARQIAGWKSREIFDFGRERQLSERQRALLAIFLIERTFVNDRLQLRASRINRGRPACRA